MSTCATSVIDIYKDLHAIPEVGFEEFKTSAYLAAALTAAGFSVKTGFGRTGVVGVYDSGKPGPVVMMRADMDALVHTVNGVETCVHSCGHDAHSSIVLVAAKILKEKGIACGQLRILFQAAEEKLTGALETIADGALEGVDIAFGLHLRPIQEGRSGEATPALCHGASYIMEATIEGLTAHGARPHLGINAIDAAAAVVQAVNAIKINPVIPCTIKTTKLQAGGATLNAIPDLAELAFDLRAQQNDVMEELIKKATAAIENAATSVGAKATATVKGGVPAAQYDDAMVAIARDSILSVLGPEGLLDPITSPGGEDFHYFAQKYPALKTAYIGLGCNLEPGLHRPDMSFDLNALPNGVKIMVEMVERALQPN